MRRPTSRSSHADARVRAGAPCRPLVGCRTSSARPTMCRPRRRGGVATQRPAKPCTPVRFRSAPLAGFAVNRHVGSFAPNRRPRRRPPARRGSAPRCRGAGPGRATLRDRGETMSGVARTSGRSQPGGPVAIDPSPPTLRPGGLRLGPRRCRRGRGRLSAVRLVHRNRGPRRRATARSSLVGAGVEGGGQAVEASPHVDQFVDG